MVTFWSGTPGPQRRTTDTTDIAVLEKCAVCLPVILVLRFRYFIPDMAMEEDLLHSGVPESKQCESGQPGRISPFPTRYFHYILTASTTQNVRVRGCFISRQPQKLLQGDLYMSPHLEKQLITNALDHK